MTQALQAPRDLSFTAFSSAWAQGTSFPAGPLRTRVFVLHSGSSGSWEKHSLTPQPALPGSSLWPGDFHFPSSYGLRTLHLGTQRWRKALKWRALSAVRAGSPGKGLQLLSASPGLLVLHKVPMVSGG